MSLAAELTRTSKGYRRNTDRGASRVFRWIATSSAGVLLGILAAVAFFLIYRAVPAFTASPAELADQGGLPEGMTSLADVVGPLVFGTVLAAILALAVSLPVSMGVALFTSHYAPKRLASILSYLVDLLAAIPSVVYGLWGSITLAPLIAHVWTWLASVLNVLPFWTVTATATGRNIATASTVLAIMILPIITSISREVFKQTPVLHEEAALALGATQWEVVRMAVIPFGRSGVISAAMLGLGRALGETMAVLMILSPGILFSGQIFDSGQHQTIAAYIASQFPESAGLAVNVLIATGLALFVITMVVNMIARWIVSRRKEFSGAN
ncbi:MAG: phosphate ABC transporter permease subunit PstC [Cellulomonadaceae bacterium]|jgi:phosphate transport system permease protein|nr:phosphate ABC transporter permease subunit PstC [Cellulomonadaceae bacterium]